MNVAVHISCETTGAVEEAGQGSADLCCLVCGAENLSDEEMEICLVEPAEVTNLIDLDSKTVQSMRVGIQERKRPVVTGTLSGKSRGIKVPRNRVGQLDVPGS